MSNPVILAVDDDPADLGLLEGELRKRYSGDYEVFCYTSAREALETLERLPLLFETSLPGVFAAGDVRHRSVKRVASAVGEGSIAIQLVHEYLGS